MKKLLVLIFTLCNISPSLAEDITNIDTPVNWSYSAIYNTFMDLIKNEATTKSVAHRISETIVVNYIERNKNQPQSPRWLCEEYQTLAKTPSADLLKIYDCYDVLTKLVEYHNSQVQSNSRLKPIDTSTPDKQVYWLPYAIKEGCHTLAQTWVDAHSKNGYYQDYNEEENVYRLQYNKCMNEVSDYTNLYNSKWSINQLYNLCKEHVFHSAEFHSYCSKMIDATIEYHNEHIKKMSQK